MKRFTLRLPKELHEALRAEARRRGKTQSEIAREALRQHLKAHEPVISFIGAGEDEELSAREAKRLLR